MLYYAALSKAGNRKCNEDFLRISSVSDRHCFVVCDGLGGHGYGDLAAQIAGNVFVDELYYCENMYSYLEGAFVKAQNKIMSRQKEKNLKNQMKTTVVCMATDGEKVYVGHIGDSRFYGFTNDNNYIRTLDHSIPQILVQAKTIDEIQIRDHPNRNMLVRVMGEEWSESLYELCEPFSLRNYRAFLLCTDGFWELIRENEMIFNLENSKTPKEWLDKMVEIVENKGENKKMDNYSAIAIFNSDIKNIQ